MPAILDICPAAGAVVRVISDLHLGHERCEVGSLDRLNPLLEGCDLLVVAGDLAEGRACEWAARGAALRAELRERCRARGVQLIELSGNHDPEIEPLLLRLWGGKVVIMHGHALFKVVAPWSWEFLNNRKACLALARSYPDSATNLEARLELSRAMSQLIAPVMRREGIRNSLLRGFLHCFWPPQRPIGIVLSWLTCGPMANRFAKRYLPEAELVIFGHFHRSGRWRFGHRLLLNTGAWFRHATPYVAELRDGQLVSYRRVD